MRSFKTFIKENHLPDHIGWYPVRQIQDLSIGQKIRSPDGLGEILKIINFPISPDDYCDTLFDRALIYSLILFYQVLENLSNLGKIEPLI